MVPKKIKSKRVRTAHKHRILGRIRDHHRKERRAARKSPGKHNSKFLNQLEAIISNNMHLVETKKDPGIPNEWPFKEELLNEIQAQKNEAEEEKLRDKQVQQAERAKAKKAAKKAEVAENIAAAKAAAAAAARAAVVVDKKPKKTSKK
ncbi:hypothetical protein MAM1_0053d03465 [Mucor ambiguus]|uniref:Guanine nucleotide-binding protein-like 3 N-terminal domain-containing protein n=1 Tax=Mucor ambiguus TaxID=91626 RepID=A0A0C9M9M7_9FUNG|nr:hypothetical protein MAM1_0053d03465 [Mucor ambiguus]